MAQFLPVSLTIALVLILTVGGSARAENHTALVFDPFCPEDDSSCLTLNEYAASLRINSSTENVTLLLLAGNHSLTTDLIVEGISNFTMFSDSDDVTNITCNVNSSVQFYSINRVNMSRLMFHGCKVSFFNVSDQVTVNQCEIRGDTVSMDTGLEISFVSFAHITESTFSLIRKTSVDLAANGSAIYVSNSQILIADCIFENNFAFNGGAVFALETSIAIVNCSFTNNHVLNCGGAVVAQQCNVTISNSSFVDNSIQPERQPYSEQYFLLRGCFLSGGAVSFVNSIMPVEISDSEFDHNMGQAPLGNKIAFGGAVYSIYSIMAITNSVLSRNSIPYAGGAIGLLHSTLQLYDSMLIENIADFGGGGVGILFNSTLESYNTSFINNTVKTNEPETGGGAIGARDNTIILIDGGLFSKNSAPGILGGAIVVAYGTSLIVKNAVFSGNEAQFGGAILAAYMNNVPIIHNCSFISNRAQTGAAMSIYSSRVTISGSVNVRENTADLGVIFIGSGTIFLSGNFTFTNNFGSIYIYNGLFTFDGESKILNNTIKRTHGELNQGGGLTSFQSTVNFTGDIHIMYNEANNGGGIVATESLLYNFGNMTIKHNRARESGGGMYAYQSGLHTRKSMYIGFNEAGDDGGGVYSVSTTIVYTKGSLVFESNRAVGRGGAMYLESDSKIYINKEVAVCSFGQANVYRDCIRRSVIDNLILNFTSNTATHGGALFVADNTTAGTCSTTQSSVNAAECFYQVLVSYNLDISDSFGTIILNNTYFSNNSATVSGGTLYGGLLDRCLVSSFAEVMVNEEGQVNNGLAYFNQTSNLDITRVSSSPVRVCFCNGTIPDCAHQPPIESVYKGQTFKISVVAVDQVNNTIPNTTIHAFVQTSTQSLGEGQSVQRTMDGCTELEYNVFSPSNTAKLYLYAEGPCKDRGISITSITIELTNCPIGFRNQNNRCECDTDIDQYIRNCSIDSQSVVRVNNTVWISYINDNEQSGYIKYSNCPFDYCRTAIDQEIIINFNEMDGSDAQCAFNRSGILCGSCANGMSVILGSSRCRDCSGKNAYLSLLVVFALAGVLLVTFILTLNLTVAVGTINGLIFYANIIATNRAIFIRSFTSSNILHLFIAWINLDFGFETCFFNGMDDYSKTWLQLAFPLYILFLVILVIVIAERSHKMANLLGNRNPVATLATLILLSYTKGLRVIITALLYAILEYPSTNGSLANPRRTVWLADGNVNYFEVEHIPLFIGAIIILMVGILYTLFIFSWQWLQQCPNWKCLKWINNPKLKSFMDGYHAPYKAHHRYWTGFLLLARTLLYLIASSVNYNPGFIFLAIVIIVSILLFFTSAPTGGGPYKNWPLNILELSFIFNLLIFAFVSYHIHVNDSEEHIKEKSQNALANTSMSIAFITFILILIYHTIVFVAIRFTKIQNLVEKIKRKFFKNKGSHVRFFKSEEQPEIPALTETLLKSKNSIRLQRRLDLIGDEPVDPAPQVESSVQSMSNSEITYTVIDGIPVD